LQTDSYDLDSVAKEIIKEGKVEVEIEELAEVWDKGGKGIEKFCELTGATPMLGRFMPGTLTNPLLPYYTEPQLVLVSDPQTDAQAVLEATNAGIPVIAISNTDNITSMVDLVIPANNRGRKSLAATYWLLAREILLQSGQLKEGQSMKYEIDDFETKITEEELIEEPVRGTGRFDRLPRQ